MKFTAILFLMFTCFTFAKAVNAQNCDPWIVKAYKQLYSIPPTTFECDPKLYNKASWSSYDQLRGLIRAAHGNNTRITSPRLAEADCNNGTYFGICKIYQFFNEDFYDPKRTCGQAAAATAVWHAGINTNYNQDVGRLAVEIYKVAPPKITVAGIDFKNVLGTDWVQMERALKTYLPQGIKFNWQTGKSALQNELRKSNVCIIMLDTGTLPQYKYAWGTGHWVVAYGFDNAHVYVTNFEGGNKMTWAELNKAWGGAKNEGNLAKAHGTPERFITVWKD